MNGAIEATQAQQQPRPQARRITLPLFLTDRNKTFFGFVWFVMAATLYLATNHFHFFTPTQLPMSWIDELVPFAPHTVWIYLSEYSLFIATYLICKDNVNLNKYLYSFIGLQVVSCLIFILWPTTFPRAEYPLPSSLDAATFFVFNLLRTADTPASCAPSLHVSSVYLSSFVFLDEQRGKFPFFFFWASAIGFTTLTTKQHYFIDVLTGLLLAIAIYWVFHRWISYRPMAKSRG